MDRGNASVAVERVDGFGTDFTAANMGNPLSVEFNEKPLFISPDTHILTLDLTQYVALGAGAAFRGGAAIGLGVDAVSLETYIKINFARGHSYRISARRTDSGFDVTLWDETGVATTAGTSAKPTDLANWQFYGAKHFVTVLSYAKFH
jgi:hypothetical protein